MTTNSKIKTDDRWTSVWKRRELVFLILYAIAFYSILITRSLCLYRDHYTKLYGLRPGWLFPSRFNDVSDAQWRNFRANLPILSIVFLIYVLVANVTRSCFLLRAKGMSIVWLFISFTYLFYLHQACVVFIFSIALLNFILVKVGVHRSHNMDEPYMSKTFKKRKYTSYVSKFFCNDILFIAFKNFARKKVFPFVLWGFNIFFLLFNRLYDGYSFSIFGQRWSYLDSYRGSFRWHICFNFVVLRMISFGYDYHWANNSSLFDQKKHILRCQNCKSGTSCYQLLQERCVQNDKFTFTLYLCYLIYAPLYLAGPIVSFNAFASQLDAPHNKITMKAVTWYGLRWVFCLLLMELMTHLFCYNAFAISGLWKLVSPLDTFIIGYGVLNFMWLKFLLIWRYFRFWSLLCGIEAPENMPRCINNCYNLESFWKNWHASYNKWLVRYLYVPLGGSSRKLLNVWVIFTFVAIWHDLEWKLLSWAWLTCLFYIPEMVFKSAANAFQAESAVGVFLFRELRAVAGAITITCLMVANLVGYVIGPSGMNLLISKFLKEDGLAVLGGMFLTFYVGTKLMFHVRDIKQSHQGKATEESAKTNVKSTI